MHLPRAGGIRASLLAAGLALGCGHTEPFSNPPYGSDEPFDPSPPVQLTYNTGPDRRPAWLADGSGVLYSAQQPERPDRDVCLALLPPSGGSQRGLWCDIPDGANRTDAAESAAPGAGGRVAFVAATGTIGGVNPVREAIVAASLLDPADEQTVRTFPYTAAGGTQHGTAEHLRWLDDARLAFVGQEFRTRQLCATCVVDTFRIGREVVVLETGTANAPPAALPGTSNATGAATDAADPDQIYFTVGGDSRVYRRTLSSGATVVVHDFGPAGIARDIHVAAGRLAAVVGGRAAFAVDPQFGPMQWDSGGVVQVVDLATGTAVQLEPGPRLYRRPALSPGGTALVAEGYDLVFTQVPTEPPTVDTTVAKTGDLFLFGAP